MNKITAGAKSTDARELNKSSGSKNTTGIKELKKLEEVSNKDSLKIATKKASNTNAAKKPKLEDTIQNVLTHGLNYFKEVRKKAQEDKANGVKPIQGAKDLWSQISTQAGKIGQEAQDQVLDDFVKQTGTVIADSVKDTQVGNLIDDLLGSGNTAKATTTNTGTAITNTHTKATQATGTLAPASLTNKVLGGVGAAYSLYQIYDTFGKSSPVEGAMNGATVGAYAGSFFSPIGTVVGGVLGAVVGAGLGMINNRKHPERIQRDQMRTGLAEYGFIDKDHNIKLADGSNYSISTDSKNTLPSLDGTKRYGYQIDFSNPLAGKAIALSQPLAEVLTGGHDKLKTDLIGYLVNAATSNAKNEEEVKANIRAFYEQSKLSEEDLATNLVKLTEANKISQEEIQVYANDLSSFYVPELSDNSDAELLAA